MVLSIVPAPHHRCVAFGAISSQQDVQGAELRLLNPGTKQLFANIREAGTFPRRWLRGSSTAREHPDSLASVAAAPLSARQYDSTERRRLLGMDSRGGSSSTNGTGLSQEWVVASPAYLSGESPVPMDQKQSPQNLKEFFPASAR
ncbi:unnamed protein product [Polarella glacialis]|uniref:Uncharacterized protein n=1 Tax=Polarella glacialis TaxID=89957 RepID=A0A813D8X6_POLGL|nr:unnamed protein product [Polarella glacialis]CAE8658442.1 unnamed protein product [Polarella glacialis]